MVIPLLGVKTRCADKSTAEHYEHTIHTWRNERESTAVNFRRAKCKTHVKIRPHWSYRERRSICGNRYFC